MSEITWVQLGFPADLLEQIDALIGIAGSDRSDVIITLLKGAIPSAANANSPTVLTRLTQVEQQLVEVQQAISDLQRESSNSTSSPGRVEPIQSADVPEDWIEEPYEVLEGFLPTEEPLIRRKLVLAADEAEHDFLEEPDEVLADFLES